MVAHPGHTGEPWHPVSKISPQRRRERRGKWREEDFSADSAVKGNGRFYLIPDMSDRRRLFHDQIILYGFDTFDASGDFNRFIDGFFRIDKAAQLNGALVSFHTDLE